MPIASDFEPVPEATVPLSRTFLDAMWEHFVRDPKRIAMVSAADESDCVTFGELYAYSHAVSAFLEECGFARGDTFCTVLPNSWQFVTALIAASLRGGTLSPASHMFTQYELQQQFRDSRSKMVFCSDANVERVFQAAQQVLAVTIIVVMAEERGVLKTLPSHEKIHFVHYDDILTRSAPHIQRRPHEHEHIDVNRDVFLLPYSSGTTGSPKGVMLSHRNVGTMIKIQDNHFKKNILGHIYTDLADHARDYSLMLLPLYHIYGLVITVSELISGISIVFMRCFEPHLFCSTIEKYRIRILKVVPPILVFLAKHPLPDQFDMSSVEFIFTGAAPAGRDLCVELIEKYPNLVSIAQGYGMTELSLGCLFPCLKDGKHRYETSGKLTSNFEMKINSFKIVDVGTGQEVPRGQPGELCFRGPTVMLGYLGRPDATAETIDSDGWLKSGDIGIMDEEGFVRVVDRRKELIKVKGFQVPPAELESLLLTHPQIKDCAVIGVTDGVSGELPKAYIVRADKALSAGEVRDYVKERAAHYKQLKGGVEFVDEIPKSPSGKILRRFLRDSEQNKSKI